MPNDAKLGLLAGVLGVIIAATISGKSPPPPLGIAGGPPAGTSPQSSPPTKAQGKANDVAAPAVVPSE
jgi:hypothetical protein